MKQFEAITVEEALVKFSSFQKMQRVDAKAFYEEPELRELLDAASTNFPDDRYLRNLHIGFRKYGIELFAEVRRFRRLERAARGISIAHEEKVKRWEDERDGEMLARFDDGQYEQDMEGCT